eukprot:SAG31_NODE_14546_length_800_cov_1.168331_1_plen_47_part_01
MTSRPAERNEQSRSQSVGATGTTCLELTAGAGDKRSGGGKRERAPEL